MESELARKKEAMLGKVARGEDVSSALKTIEVVMRAAEAGADYTSRCGGNARSAAAATAGGEAGASDSPPSSSSASTPTTVLEGPSSWSARIQNAMNEGSTNDYFAE